MKISRIAIVFAAAFSLAACANTNAGEKETLGTLIGAGLGGLAGSQIGSGSGKLAAVGAGVLLGGLLGREAGRSLDKADRLYAERTAAQALEKRPDGTTSTWKNPNTGNSGTFTPKRTYETAEGQPCREYETTVTIDGKTEIVRGTACREPDGRWTVVN